MFHYRPSMENDVLSGVRPERNERSRREKRRTSKNQLFTTDENVFNLNWSAQSMIAPHRLLGNGDSTFAPYPVPIAFPVEPYPYSMYPQVYPTSVTPPFYPVPPARKGRRKNGNKKNLNSNRKDINCPEQQYASLPPTNCDAYSDKSSESDTNSKRHFSDPGIGPASSVESLMSLDTNTNPMYQSLVEEIRYLRESSRKLSSELVSVRDEIRKLKVNGCPSCKTFDQPGSLSETVGELRKAANAREEAIIIKLDAGLESSNAQNKQNFEQLSKRLDALEEEIEQLKEKRQSDTKSTENLDKNLLSLDRNTSLGGEKIAETEVPDAFRMLRLLEQEKHQLEKDLQKAVADRSEAEANTQKLERLVAILRAKVNGLSADTCSVEERLTPVVNNIEKNPFVVMDSLGKPYPKVAVDKVDFTESAHKPITNNVHKTVNLITSPKHVQPVCTKMSASPTVPVKPPNLSLLPKPTHTVPKSPNNCPVTIKTSPNQVAKRNDLIKPSSNLNDESKPEIPEPNSSPENTIRKFIVSDASVREIAIKDETESETSTEDSTPPSSSLGGTITMTGRVTHF